MKNRLMLLAVLAAACTNNLLAQSPRPASTQRIYPVADLVVPIPNYSGSEVSCDNCPLACTGATAAARKKTRETELIKTIVSTVSPKSWLANGGLGQIDYYPTGMAIVVANTPEVIQEVGDLLDSMRKSMDTQVVIEIRLAQISAETFEKIAACSFCATGVRKERCGNWFANRCLPLDEAEAVKLFGWLQETDPKLSVLQAPKLTMFSGQKGYLKAQCDPETMCWKMQPRVSADGKQVGLSLSFNWSGAVHETTLCLPSDGYCLIGGRGGELDKSVPPTLSKVPYVNRLFKNANTDSPKDLHWVALIKVSAIAPEKLILQGITPTPFAKPMPYEQLLDSVRDQLKPSGEEPAAAPPPRRLPDFEIDINAGSLPIPLELRLPRINEESPIFDLLPEPRLDFYTEWNLRWLTETKPSMRMIRDWVPVVEPGVAKPGPQLMERIGIDFD